MSPPFRFLALMLLAAVLTPITAHAQELVWSVVKKGVRMQYAAVPLLSTDSLAAWLATPDRPAPVLLDVRGADEYAVSHLPGALHIDPDATTFPQLDGLPAGTPIVAYCSVGYRSGALGERLQAAGFSTVYNLEGSIFQWANEGRPVHRDGQPVSQVHPYNTRWGRLLDTRYH